MHLIRADSPEKAYDKAIELGQDSEMNYENTDGKQVEISFLGLTDLSVIYEELEDGAELSFQEDVGITEEELAQMLTEKENLSVFRPIERSEGPNYLDREIAEEMSKDFRDKITGDGEI